MITGLVGSVYISSGVGAFSTSLNADIDETSDAEAAAAEEDADDDPTEAEPEAKEKKSRMLSLIYSGMERVIKNLLKRAKSWKTAHRAENVTLTSGISVSDPILGAISFSISMTATIPSLLAYIETHKDADK